MRSLWSDGDAAAMVARYGAAGVGRDLALRVYTSRLLGGDPRLVLHGGGNTSVKTVLPDLSGDPAPVLVRQGQRLGAWRHIEPRGVARRAPRADPEAARHATRLTDEDMVPYPAGQSARSGRPQPVGRDAAAHAFLPHRYVDHTHAMAVLSLADQPDTSGLSHLPNSTAGAVGIVPSYIMPGFLLAKAAAEVFETDPTVEGLVLVKHGVFSFGAGARAEAYERMIALVSLAEERLGRGRSRVFSRGGDVLPALHRRAGRDRAGSARRLRAVRPGDCGALPSALLLDFRAGPAILNFVNGAELSRYGQAGVATPDHAIRTKRWPLIVPPPEDGRLEDFAAAAREAVARYAAEYRAYFGRNSAASGGPHPSLPRDPRVKPGEGRVREGEARARSHPAGDPGAGRRPFRSRAQRQGCRGRRRSRGKLGQDGDRRRGGRTLSESLSEAELFEMEYWSLEQAKLGSATEKPLAGQVALVTGGAGTIGLATARALKDAGAEIVLTDREGAGPEDAAKKLGGLGLVCDVTDPAAVHAAFDRVAERFGGVDIVVSNAGAAWQGKIGEVDDAVLRQSFELNFFAHQSVAQNAVRIMRAQGTGGVLLFNVSRQAVSPEARPRRAVWAAQGRRPLFLMRQYALPNTAPTASAPTRSMPTASAAAS